ncbi:MAG: MBL fold metallo-hydrolase [Actinomycetia bacterium]|nr:MBL fold metallo-hydrolase [Actinomycetes bacterium]MCH9701365.1 MBL fold metallo-hydrolase [Actinomycetes bacterium]MCH9760593.1 MBL fold metallo-hydrolase [Actinomycetes bacterium]
MKISHYLYNAFLIQHGDVKVAVDPGQNLWIFALRSLIPRSEWPDVTHLVITHGDPDHHWQSDRVAKVSGAHVICGRGLTRKVGERTLVVAPRGRALTSWIPLDNLHPLDVGESVTLDGVRFDAVKTVHGPIAVPILGFTYRAHPGPQERVGIGAMGFKISIAGTSILNLGDTILVPEWEHVRADVLMVPIGGLGSSTWTMDVDEALEAVRLIQPQRVIPCHYNAPFFWKRRAAVADDQRFQREVERMGIECTILGYGETITI